MTTGDSGVPDNIDLAAVKARHARDDEGIDEADTLADIPALIEAVEERDAEIARLREALGDAVSTVAGGQLRSIGAIGDTRVAQVDVARLDRWREALRQTGTES